MNFELEEYCIALSSAEDNLLYRLRRETHMKTLRPSMISDPLLGQFLKTLVTMNKPKSILEIGTFTGYSSLWMASGMHGSGRITTLELDEELSYFHNKYFSESPFGRMIKVIYGDANQFLSSNTERYEMVFMDAGKKDYITQFELLVPNMKSGDVIVADNVLWKSLVVNEEKDKMTSFMHEFNKHVSDDKRVDNIIIPLRDGVNIITKK